MTGLLLRYWRLRRPPLRKRWDFTPLTRGYLNKCQKGLNLVGWQRIGLKGRGTVPPSAARRRGALNKCGLVEDILASPQGSNEELEEFSRCAICGRYMPTRLLYEDLICFKCKEEQDRLEEN